jgi:hypothetical protein
VAYFHPQRGYIVCSPYSDSDGSTDEAITLGAAASSWESLLLRIKGEYLEMPGLALTVQQAQRLWALDGHTCEAALRRLVQTGFLITTRAGRFVLAATQVTPQQPITSYS